jgi:uncharacterized protein involved in exopolysaccharide biosynthesis
MNEYKPAPIDSAEIPLRELILKIWEWVSYLRAKWISIILIGLVFAAIGYMYAASKKLIYTADLTFALEEEKAGGGGLSGALGFATSLGIDVGGGGAGGAFSGSNLLELMKSRTLIEKALLNPITVNGKTLSLADYYIELTGSKKEKDEPAVQQIRFNVLDDRTKFTLAQDSVLGVLYQQIAGSGTVLSVSQKDKKISIITIEVKSTDQLFSKIFAETVARVVSDFYIDTKSKKAKLNYEILQRQTDSIRNELNAAITGVALANDNTYNLNPALNVHRAPSARRQVDVQANTAILTQLVANLEMAKVSLRRETPLIQIIDTPILPLRKDRPSKLNALIIGGLLGVGITLIFWVLIRLWKMIMHP